ncbi:hypothetical protein [Nocardia sp. NPDC005825]
MDDQVIASLSTPDRVSTASGEFGSTVLWFGPQQPGDIQKAS